jgi:hypothetical protein
LGQKEGSTLAENEWLKLWSDLVRDNYQPREEERMVRYKDHARKRQERPDPLLDFIIGLVDSQDSVIEIGPGNGRWTLPLARRVRRVTAVEPADTMAAILAENIQSAGLQNVTIVPEPWEKVSLERHTICVCAHAMYNSPDLAAFVRKMEAGATRLCALSIRIPPAEGVMAAMSEQIYGRRHDSPDAVIAFNALYRMGLNVNVRIEEGIVNWTNNSLDEALARARRHLRVEESDRYDQAIRETLQQRLVLKDGVYIWPDGMRSALLYWQPGRIT